MKKKTFNISLDLAGLPIVTPQNNLACLIAIKQTALKWIEFWGSPPFLPGWDTTLFLDRTQFNADNGIELFKAITITITKKLSKLASL